MQRIGRLKLSPQTNAILLDSQYLMIPPDDISQNAERVEETITCSNDIQGFSIAFTCQFPMSALSFPQTTSPSLPAHTTLLSGGNRENIWSKEIILVKILYGVQEMNLMLLFQVQSPSCYGQYTPSKDNAGDIAGLRGEMLP